MHANQGEQHTAGRSESKASCVRRLWIVVLATKWKESCTRPSLRASESRCSPRRRRRGGGAQRRGVLVARMGRDGMMAWMAPARCRSTAAPRTHHSPGGLGQLGEGQRWAGRDARKQKRKEGSKGQGTDGCDMTWARTIKPKESRMQHACMPKTGACTVRYPGKGCCCRKMATACEHISRTWQRKAEDRWQAGQARRRCWQSRRSKLSFCCGDSAILPYVLQSSHPSIRHLPRICGPCNQAASPKKALFAHTGADDCIA